MPRIGLLRTMFYHKPKLYCLTLLSLASLATSTAYFCQAHAKSDDQEAPAPSLQPRASRGWQARIRPHVRIRPRARPSRKTGAWRTVMLHARKLGLAYPDQVRLSLIPIAEARAGNSGQFRLNAPRTSSSAYYDRLGGDRRGTRLRCRLGQPERRRRPAHRRHHTAPGANHSGAILRPARPRCPRRDDLRLVAGANPPARSVRGSSTLRWRVLL